MAGGSRALQSLGKEVGSEILKRLIGQVSSNSFIAAERDLQLHAGKSGPQNLSELSCTCGHHPVGGWKAPGVAAALARPSFTTAAGHSGFFLERSCVFPVADGERLRY